MTKVCRLCLMKLQRGSKYFNINAVESFTGFMPYRDQLTTCIPEMALDLIPNPVICNTCRSALKAAYDFKSRCLFVEKKIQQFIETQNYDQNNQINYDLTQIPNDDVPPFLKYSILLPKSDVHDQDEGSVHPEKYLKIQSDETPSNTEPDREPEKDSINSSEHEEESTSVSDSNTTRSPNRRFHKPHRSYPRGRMSVSRIYSQDDFVCNFCHESFRSLQFLRKHNNICSKSIQKESTKTILTKRPHLPTKAKNHLKKWLFRHTDHPYPTDQEKQMLMQETNLSLLQVENWFINARRRILQDLTKLKSMRGIRSEDLCDSSLGLEMDYEDLVPQNTLINNKSGGDSKDPLDVQEGHANPPEEVNLPGPPENMVKEEEGDIEEEHVDLAKVKCEIIDNR